MKKILITFICLALTTGPLFAGRVVLKSGQVLDGKVETTATGYTVVRGGMTSEVSRNDVASVDLNVETVWDTFTTQYETTRWDSTSSILKLVDFAKSNRELQAEVKGLYRKVLAVNPQHDEANRALDRRMLNSQWVSKTNYMESIGMVQSENDQWITREERALANAKVMHKETVDKRVDLIASLFDQLKSNDEQIVSQAKQELEGMDEYYPGLSKWVNKTRDFFSANDIYNDVSFDGKYITMVIRITDVQLDPESAPPDGLEGLELELGTGGGTGANNVTVQLPHQRFMELRSTLMIPAN